jgi:hypothetical protein
MKAIKLVIALLVLGVAGAGNAWADRHHHGGGHVQFGLVIGPMWGPWYYPPPAYYYPPYYSPVIVERPQVYIEQQPALAAPPPAASAPAPTNYWYYCAASKGYYPYVKTCRDGWQKVAPQPPGQP